MIPRKYFSCVVFGGHLEPHEWSRCISLTVFSVLPVVLMLDVYLRISIAYFSPNMSNYFTKDQLFTT